jgi:hypothetical protein
MGRCRIGVAVVAALLCSIGAVGFTGAAHAQSAPSVRWYVDSNPTCPTLHGDSINGGSGDFAVLVQGEDTGLARVVPGDNYVLEFSSQPYGTNVNVVVYDFDGFSYFETDDVSIFCRATTAGPPSNAAANPGNGAATVSWTAPASNGGTPILGYRLTAYVGYYPVKSQMLFGATSTSQIMSGLTNGVEYRFRVQAVNEIGDGAFSKVTKPITAGTPTAPTIGTATAGTQSATVTWTPPATDNGSPIVGYVVTPYIGIATQGPRYFMSTATSQTIPNLTSGTTYRFRVRAWNANGVSLFSTTSNAVTPTA